MTYSQSGGGQHCCQYAQLHLGVCLENKIFTDLDFVDDVALLAEMLEVLIFALSVMQKKQCYLVLRLIGPKPGSSIG